METEYLIKKLEDQKTKVNQADTEVWLKTTYSYIEEYFRIGSSRAIHFQSLINDFTINKNFGAADESKTIKRKAIEYINEIILYLRELQERQKQELEKPKNKEEIQHNNRTNNFNKVMLASPVKPKKTQLPFDISPGLFWTIFAALISGAFILGQSIGNAKFDKEKIDLYDQAKTLQSDTMNLNKIIEMKDSIIHKKDEYIKAKNDSLNYASKELNDLYLYIGKLEEKKGR